MEETESKQENVTSVKAVLQGHHKVEGPKEGILVDITIEDSLAVVNPIPTQPKYEELLSPRDSFDFVSQLLKAEYK